MMFPSDPQNQPIAPGLRSVSMLRHTRPRGTDPGRKPAATDGVVLVPVPETTLREHGPLRCRALVPVAACSGAAAHVCYVLRAVQYEEQIAANPLNYDAWFDYLKLEESLSGPDVVRAVYERAVENIPPLATKLNWCRYVYLWIYYAVYEELVADDPGRAREVLRSCLKIIPHADFTFAKIWILAAQLEVCPPCARPIRSVIRLCRCGCGGAGRSAAGGGCVNRRRATPRPVAMIGWRLVPACD